MEVEGRHYRSVVNRREVPSRTWFLRIGKVVVVIVDDYSTSLTTRISDSSMTRSILFLISRSVADGPGSCCRRAPLLGSPAPSCSLTPSLGVYGLSEKVPLGNESIVENGKASWTRTPVNRDSVDGRVRVFCLKENPSNGLSPFGLQSIGWIVKVTWFL
jgi:hypothetical protein